MIDKALNTINNTKEEVEGIAGMSAKAIDHIIKKGSLYMRPQLRRRFKSKGNCIKRKAVNASISYRYNGKRN